MKTVEPKNSSVARLQKSSKPFFSKEGDGDFFGESIKKQTDFFKPSTSLSVGGKGVLQTKLTIGQPNDKYEQEADSMADRVVQRLATHEILTKKESTIQAKPLVNFISPLIQKKCAECEQEEKLQMKEDDAIPGSIPELQRKPIFESNAEPPEEDSSVQRKCTECEREDKLQAKSETDLVRESPLQLQCKPIFESNSEPTYDETSVQLKCAKCEEGEKLQTKEEEDLVQESPLELQCKPIFESEAAIHNGESSVQLKCTECEKEEKLQKKEEEETEEMPPLELQRKPIFESTGGFREDNSAGETETIQAKSEVSSTGSQLSQIENTLNSSKGNGSPIDRSTRQQMETTFGVDFSNVRIHNDSTAVQMSKDLHAQAFTHGSDIYFNSGKYDTGSKEGKHLLAHELTHTVQQNSRSHAQRMIQRRDIDPHKVMDDIFNDGLGRNYLKVPFKYWSAYQNKLWFNKFIDFLKLCIIDPDAIDEKSLVYMALLYSTFPKEPLDWHNGEFQLTSTDNLDGLLNVQFKLPKNVTGDMGVSIYFKSPTDHVQIDSTTKVKASAFDPLSALSFTIPDTDIASFQQSYNYNVSDGAYKGNGANFHLTYVLFTSRSALKLQTLYFNEKIEFSLVSKEKLEIQFNGKFDIPSDLTVDAIRFAKLDKELPELFARAINLDSTLGGTHSAGGDIETIVMGFAEEKHKVVSLQQFANPAQSFFDNAQIFTYRMIVLLEGFNMGRPLITEGEPPIHTTYNNLKEAEAGATRMDSPGYIIVHEGNKFVVYFLTSTDLAWLAKSLRGEEADKLPRYSGIDPDSIVDLDFFGRGGTKALKDTKAMLKASYFSSRKELLEKPPFDYFLLHRLPDGYYGAYPFTLDDVVKTWKVFDSINSIKDMKGDIDLLETVALSIQTDDKGYSFRLNIDKEHYEGRAKFRDVYLAIEAAKDQSETRTALEKFNDPQLLTYLGNELLRPNSMNPDQQLKQALQQLKGLPGSMLIGAIGERVFAWVAGEAEKKGLEMMEAMMTFMDVLVENDSIMKAMLLTFKGREAAEKKEIISLFTEGDDEAANLTAILENEETANEFVMGNAINGLSLDKVAEKLKKSRDELKGEIEKRNGWLENGKIRYENSFIIQEGELGNTIREHVYDVFGFNLDPKAFPHEDQNKGWSPFPSPLAENGPSRTSLMEQIYINKAIDTVHTFKALKTIQTVAMVASVFSLARGAGLWAVARAGIAKATFKAFVLEALVTSIVGGAMLEGIQVALGKKFSWKDLGLSIGEAFVMMLAFGWINKLIKLPITRFTVNAAGFIGVGVGHYIYTHKKLPTGFDLGLIVSEAILTMTLLHIGTTLTDPFFRRVLSKYSVDPELKVFYESLQTTVKELATESSKKAPDKGRMEQLGEQYMGLLKQYRAWLLKNKGKFTQEEIDAELNKLNILENHWADAKLADAAGLVKVAQTDTSFYYKPGADSAKALKEKYGETNVQIDEKTGLGTIKTPEGNIKLIPQDVAGKGTDPTVDGKSIIDFLGNAVRKIDFGVYGFGKANLNIIKQEILKKSGGAWEDLGDGTYSAMIGGRRVIFIEEGTTTTIDQALAMETKLKGAGMDYLNQSLSESALKGIEILKQGQLKGMSNVDVLLYLKQVSKGIQEKSYPNAPDGEPLKQKPESFHEYLEKVYEAEKGKSAKTGPDDTSTRKPELEPVVEEPPSGEKPTEDGKRRMRINEEGKCEICASPCDKIRERYAAVMTKALEARIAKIEKNGKLNDDQKLEALKPIEQKLSELNDKTAKDITNEIKKGRIKPNAGKWKYARNWEKWVNEKKGKVIEYADGSFDYIEPGGTKVRYSPDGYPDFSPYLDHPSGIKSTDIGKFDKRRWPDYEKANKKVGKEKEWGKDPPDGYRWHHHQNGTTMQLVPEWIHTLFKHAGGISNL